MVAREAAVGLPEQELGPAGTNPVYLDFSRAQWADLRRSTPLLMSEQELVDVRGINERISLDEIEHMYLPLSRLLNLNIGATQQLAGVTGEFLGQSPAKVPYVIGVAGSVAAGKSTTSRVLQRLLSRWPNHARVDLVTTDGFLLPKAELNRRGIMHRKGHPESYDRTALIRFLTDIKAGKPDVPAPVYSHHIYDVMPDLTQTVDSPDVLIIEGLNVLQTSTTPGETSEAFVADFLDFTIYVDADEAHLQEWYVERFKTLCRTAFQDPSAHFHQYAGLSTAEADATARRIWQDVNLPNLVHNIAPTRGRAHLILEKSDGHLVHRVRLRRF